MVHGLADNHTDDYTNVDNDADVDDADVPSSTVIQATLGLDVAAMPAKVLRYSSPLC